MKKAMVIFIMAILLTMNALAYVRMPLARVDDVVRAGDYLEVITVGQNMGNDMEDVHVTVYIPDLYEWQSDTIHRFDDDKYISKKFYMYIPPETRPGIYDIKMLISDGHQKRVKYRTFEVY